MKKMKILLHIAFIAITLLFISCGNDDDAIIVANNVISVQDLAVTIDENPTVGQVVGTVQTTQTVGGGSLVYSITTQTPTGALNINASTGELTVADATLFDYETNQTITATISLIGVTNTAMVTINLNNLPDILVNYTETIRPDVSDGKDAFIYEYNADQNLATHPDFMAGMYNSQETRNLIRFDFSQIPAGATVQSVELSLYSYNSTANGTHSGINTSLLQRVTSSWEEDTVTWNSQPITTVDDEVVLVNSTMNVQNYLDIDVTNMTSYMIANPSNNYGFMLRLEDETNTSTRRMLFASSDNADSDLHPKVVIEYSVYE
ncbi:MAG: hypothetical protein COA88_06450 [Kordia sp.]|nr:MAG: hypothetical protein COA88_06450 [Kordia sp.]